jgi:hypothetical protein
MFRLTAIEWKAIRSQTVIAPTGCRIAAAPQRSGGTAKSRDQSRLRN